jgi:hypothetical protein
MAALSGNLREFELADIFQLIGQQKKTGRLLLQDGDRQAFAIFQNGSIVNAGSDNETIISYFITYLTKVKRVPQRKLSEFIEHCKGATSVFADILVKIQYLSEQELNMLAAMGLEDLACNLFNWKKGAYRFEPLTHVDDHVVRGISFSIDSIVMEAMRRLDELKRIGPSMRQDAIYVPTQAAGHYMQTAESIPRYLLSLMDGRKILAQLCENLFFSRYRAYEALFPLLQQRIIIEIPRDQAAQMRPQQAADNENREVVEAGVSALITALIIIAVAIFGFFVCPTFIYGSAARAAYDDRVRLMEAQTDQKTRIAVLQYQADRFQRPQQLRALTSERYLYHRDAAHRAIMMQ